MDWIDIDAPMSLRVGVQIGPYESTSLLGSGGMGEVYLAKDHRLGREVAIKVLPAEFIKDADRVKRFQQEARAASSLNHPNIITIYDVGQTDSNLYIVMEYIEGKTLRELIDAGSLPLRIIRRAVFMTFVRDDAAAQDNPRPFRKSLL